MVTGKFLKASLEKFTAKQTSSQKILTMAEYNARLAQRAILRFQCLDPLYKNTPLQQTLIAINYKSPSNYFERVAELLDSLYDDSDKEATKKPLESDVYEMDTVLSSDALAFNRYCIALYTVAETWRRVWGDRKIFRGPIFSQ